MNIKDLFSAVRPLKNRMHVNSSIFCIVTGLTTASAICLLLSLVSLIFPVPYLINIIILAYCAVILLSLLISAFLRPSALKVMKTADSLGLKERLITAYQLMDDFSPIAKIQRYDTIKAVSRTDFRSLYPLRIPKKLGALCLALSLITVISLFIPSNSRDIAAKLEKLFDEIKKQAEKIDNKRKDINKNAGISDEKLKEINKKIDQLLKELKQSKSEGEAVKALLRTKHELEELKKNGSSTDLAKLAENLSRHPMTSDIANALKNGGATQIKQLLENLNNSLKNLDELGRKDLAEHFKNVAEEISQNKDLAQNLHDLASAISSGKLGSASSELANLERTLSQLAASDPKLASAMQQLENQALRQIMDSMDSAKRQISSQSSNSQLANGSGRQGNASGSGKQEVDLPEQGKQPGQGVCQGGSKGEKGGNGAGDGTTNKDAGYSGEESLGRGREPGKKQVKDYESIYVPERLQGGEGSQSLVNGRKTGSGRSDWTQSENAPVQKGTVLPYDQVLGKYKSEAMSSLDESAIPPVMKDIVRDYFTSLE
ncbi:MAG: hypothetical protein N2489_01445 [Clostridia bacterium]|nr:hypothetical protein [Clostridia bacterium]